MPQQNLKRATGADGIHRSQDGLGKLDVAAEGHLEREAVGEGKTFSDGSQQSSIFGRPFRTESQVPELDEQGLQPLDLKYFSESHAGK